MTTTMGRGWGRAVACLGLCAVMAAGCDEGVGAGETEVGAAETAAGTPADVAAAPDETAPAAVLELERILRRVERGGATPADVDALAAIVRDGALPVDALDRAGLALSRAREETGDREGAIRAVEDVLRRHGGDRRGDTYGVATRRLRLLVTGTEEEPPRLARHLDPIAPVARALAAHFPEDERGATLVDVLTVGRRGWSDPRGILDVGGAKRQMAEEECAVCDVDVKTQGSHTRIGSWVDLPAQSGERRADMPNPDRSLVIVHFDLVENRVPSRYDAVLAIPSDDVVARLERGEAFIAVRERPGKKPLVLLAAPRAAQLDAVEAAFAQLTELPTTPHTVDVAKGLLPDEIRGVVRGGFKTLRTCYEELLAREPGAEGKVTVKMRIDGRGQPDDVTASATFGDAAVASCIADGIRRLRFPATGESTSVTYPIAFSP